MEKRQLGANGLKVSALGLGCMSMSMGYGNRDDAHSMATLQRAIDLGVTLLDTADMYGWGHNETLIGQAIKGQRDKVVLATKLGIRLNDQGLYVDGSPSYIKESCEGSLKRLGVDVIDLYYLHRVSPSTPIEESVSALAELVKEGKVRHIGLSEVRPETIRRAMGVHPISAIQTEYSLWQREPEREILSTCRELGISFVPFSPLGRGFLTGAVQSIDGLAEDDYRRLLPRFQGENFQENKKLLVQFKELAAEKNSTPAQLALAWLLAQGDDIVPIPGTKKISYLEENLKALDIKLSASDLAALDRMFPVGVAKGKKFPDEHDLES